MFSGKGIMEDISFHLIIIPVSRQRLQTNETGEAWRIIVSAPPCEEAGDKLMMRLVLSLLREIICCAVFVFLFFIFLSASDAKLNETPLSFLN